MDDREFHPSLLSYVAILLSEADDELNELTTEDEFRGWAEENLNSGEVEFPEDATAARTFLLSYKTDQMLDTLAGDKPYPLLPWDMDETTVPVMVKMGPTPYQHEVALELALGILTYYWAVGRNSPLSIYGEPLQTDYVPQRLSQRPSGAHFTVTLRDVPLHFLTHDFLQGMATGAAWEGVSLPSLITEVQHQVDDVSEPARYQIAN
jgi:hypothetical protein